MASTRRPGAWHGADEYRSMERRSTHSSPVAPALRLALALALLLGLAGPLAPAARAAMTRYVAMTGTDSGDCSASPCRTIGYALNQAAAGDTIGVAAGFYSERLTIGKSVTLQGTGADATILDGSYAGTVVTVDGGVTATIAGVAIQRGSADTGGGVLNYGTLTLSNSTVSANRAEDAGGVVNAPGATLTLSNSTVRGNTATSLGGGVGNAPGGTLTLSNSTVSANSAASNGGGVYNEGGATLTVRNSTISANSAGTGGGGVAGGGTLTLSNSTLAGNSAISGGGVLNDGSLTLHGTILANGPGGNCVNFSGAATITSLGHNLASDGTCFLTAAGDRPNTDPQLGLLADNGGPTWTQLPQPGSPAIDGGPTTGCPATDQRGITRPQGAACDIGAVEVEVSPPAAPAYALTLTASSGDSAGGGGSYRAGATATLTAAPSDGFIFTGWALDGQFVGWANPLTLTMNGDHTAVAMFAARPAFPDVPASDPAYEAIAQLAARSIVRGYQDGRFGPADTTLRAQMAALIARAMGWDAENHYNPFPDRGTIDENLWRNVGTLAFYGVARGYPDGSYKPTNPVLHAQVISFITRAMVAKGYWVQETVDDPSLYPNVTVASGHRWDVLTYHRNAGALPGTDPTANWGGWDTPATRAWFALAEWQALDSYWGVDRVE